MNPETPSPEKENQRTQKAIESYLSDLTSAYHNDNETVKVSLGQHGYAAIDGSHISVPDSYGANLNGPQMLRMQADTTAHEVYHFNYTELEGKKDFSEKNHVAPNLAGMIYNIVEDHYIDNQRLLDFPGMRKSLAHKINIQTDEAENPRFKSLEKNPNKTQKLINGFLQVSAMGFAFGMDTCSDEIRDFLTWARLKVKSVRTMHQQSDREELSQEIFDAMMGLLPDGVEADQQADRIKQDIPLGKLIPITQELSEEEKEKFERAKQNIVKISSQESEDDEGEDSTSDENSNGSTDAESQEDSEEGNTENSENSTDEAPSEDTEDTESKEGNSDGEDAELDSEPGEGDSVLVVDVEQNNKRDDSSESGEQSNTDDTSGNDTPQGGNDSGKATENYSNGEHENTRISADELARERDRMLVLADEENSSDWYGVEKSEDLENVEQQYVRQWQKIQVAENSKRDSITRREIERNERIGKGSGHKKIRQAVLEDDLKDDIEDAFKQFKTRDHYVKRHSGERLNRRGVIRNRSGNVQSEHNYLHKQRAEKGDRAIGVALDMSGSMDEYLAKISLGALYHATSIIGDHLSISAFSTSERKDDNPGYKIHTPLVTSPNESFEWKHLDSLKPGGMTPTASGIIEAKKLLKKATRPEKVLIVITDGYPNVAPDGSAHDEASMDAAASMVEKARHEGQKVIGLGVGNGIEESNLKTMFGHAGYVMTDMNDLAQKLLKVYKRQMKVEI